MGARWIKIDVLPIIQSVNLIRKSGIQYEFRTTVVKNLLGEKDIEEISRWLGKDTPYVVQNFSPTKTLDQSFMKKETFSNKDLLNLTKQIKNDGFLIRN